MCGFHFQILYDSSFLTFYFVRFSIYIYFKNHFRPNDSTKTRSRNCPDFSLSQTGLVLWSWMLQPKTLVANSQWEQEEKTQETGVKRQRKSQRNLSELMERLSISVAVHRSQEFDGFHSRGVSQYGPWSLVKLWNVWSAFFQSSYNKTSSNSSLRYGQTPSLFNKQRLKTDCESSALRVPSKRCWKPRLKVPPKKFMRL